MINLYLFTWAMVALIKKSEPGSNGRKLIFTDRSPRPFPFFPRKDAFVPCDMEEGGHYAWDKITDAGYREGVRRTMSERYQCGKGRGHDENCANRTLHVVDRSML